jgi:ParB family chromosome partitioning protein
VRIDAAVGVCAALYDPQKGARSTEHEPQTDMVKIPGAWWGKATMTAEQAVVSTEPKDAHNLEKEKVNLTGADKTGSERPGMEKVVLDKAGAEKAGIGTPVLAHDKRRALGRGLESLLPGPRPMGGTAVTPPLAPATAPGAASGTSASAVAATDGVAGAVPGVIAELHAQAARKAPDTHAVIDLALERIDVNPHQTRTFTGREMETLKELTESIKVHGVIQPITVRPGKDGKYVLITGERRMRAAAMAGMATIPAIVRVVSEQQAAEMTVIENLQRQDLTCIDLARAFIMLSKDFGLTQEQIGERVGSSRESVSNHMRLAKLPPNVQLYLETGELDFSHARLLLNLGDPETIAKVAYKVVVDELSVDKLEELVFNHNHPIEGQKKVARGARWVDPNVKAAQRKMEEILGVRVKIRDRNGKGKISLEYSTLEDFDRILDMLTKKPGGRS